MKTNPILPIVAAALLVGCATSNPNTGDQTRRIESVARLAAFATVAAEVRSNPDARDDFENVATALTSFASSERWDLAAVTQAVLASGLNELRGPDGAVILQAGLLVLMTTDVSFEASKEAHAAALIRGLESGIRLALAVGGPQ